MGVPQTKFSEACFTKIELKNVNLQSGKHIRGKIHIVLSEPKELSVLSMRLVGEQMVKWKELFTLSNNSNNQARQAHFALSNKFSESISNTSCICNVKITLVTWNSEVQPGWHTFPFKFRLPENLPTSLNYEDGYKSAYIKYKIYASLRSCRIKVTKVSSEIFIVNPIDDIVHKGHINGHTDTRSLCLRNKGTCSLSITMSKSLYFSNEYIEIDLRIDNSKSPIEIVSILASLYYMMSLSDDKGRKTVICGPVLTKKFNIEVGAGELKGDDEGIKLNFDLSPYHEKICQVPSTKTNLIECVYYATIEANFSKILMCRNRPPKARAYFNVFPCIYKEPLPHMIDNDIIPIYHESIKVEPSQLEILETDLT